MRDDKPDPTNDEQHQAYLTGAATGFILGLGVAFIAWLVWFFST